MSKFIEFAQAHQDQLSKGITDLLSDPSALLAAGIKESGMDSLQYFEMIMLIEEFFTITLSEQAAAKASTFHDIDILIQSNLQGSPR